MAAKETYTYSEFLDAWEKVTSPPPLKDQLDDLFVHADSLLIVTPASRAQALADFHSLLSYRHIFS
jgi:hypothetical protein